MTLPRRSQPAFALSPLPDVVHLASGLDPCVRANGLGLVLEGLDARELAARQVISTYTVNAHSNRCTTKRASTAAANSSPARASKIIGPRFRSQISRPHELSNRLASTFVT